MHNNDNDNDNEWGHFITIDYIADIESTDMNNYVIQYTSGYDTNYTSYTNYINYLNDINYINDIIPNEITKNSSAINDSIVPNDNVNQSFIRNLIVAHKITHLSSISMLFILLIIILFI